jgi:hypothetical protein
VDLKLPRLPRALPPPRSRLGLPARSDPSRNAMDANLRELDALLRKVVVIPEGARLKARRDREAENAASRAELKRPAPGDAPESVADERHPCESLGGTEAAGVESIDKIARPGARGQQHVIIIGLGVAVATFALLAFALHLGAMERIGRLATRVSNIEEQRHGLQRLITERLLVQDKKVAGIAAHLEEARHPSGEFKNAQDLMAAGRYVEAEAAYSALLASRPGSVLSPTIAANAALANAMLGKCSMMRTRLAQLTALRPQDQLLQHRELLAAECSRRRRIQTLSAR